MLSQDKIQRINELSRKSKESSLTDAEKKEQKDLRQEYLASLRSSFSNQLHSIKVVDEEGTDVTPEKLKESKKNRGILHLAKLGYFYGCNFSNIRYTVL